MESAGVAGGKISPRQQRAGVREGTQDSSLAKKALLKNLIQEGPNTL